MIQTSSPFAAANASLNKQPVFLLEIAGYSRAFTTRAGLGLGSFEGLPTNSAVQKVVLSTGGSLSNHPHSVTVPSPTPAGNLLFVFLHDGEGDFGLGTDTIGDTAGNTWTQIDDDGVGVSVWYCVSVAAPAGNVITWDLADISNHASSEFYVVEVGAQYAGFTSYASASGAGAVASVALATTTMSVALHTGGSWGLFGIELSPATSSSPGTTLGFLFLPGNSASVLYPQNAVIGAFVTTVVSSSPTTAFDWITNIDDLTMSISDLDGSSDLADLVFNVQDNQQQITADLASFVFEGKECRLLNGFVGMNLVDYAPLYRGAINTVDSDKDNTEYKFTVSSFNLKKLSAKIFAVGDDGFTTSGKHPHTISAHPLDILVAALQQAGVALSDIDTTKIYFYRDTIFSGLTFEFNLTSAPTAKDFIENELMKPLGMYYWENNLGLVSVNSFYPVISGNGSYTPPTPPVDTLDIDATTLVPLAKQADLINQIATKFDDDGSGSSKLQAENISNYDASILKYGLTDAHTIESQGLKSAFQGYLIATLVSFLIFLRYGLKNLYVDALPCLWSHCTLEPGDIIALTEPYVPDRVAGVMGITLQTFEVMDRTWKFMSGTVDVKLLAIDLSKFKQFLITPNGEASFAADTALNQAKYMYLSNASGKYSTGAPGNTLG